MDLCRGCVSGCAWANLNAYVAAETSPTHGAGPSVTASKTKAGRTAQENARFIVLAPSRGIVLYGTREGPPASRGRPPARWDSCSPEVGLFLHRRLPHLPDVADQIGSGR